MNEANNIYRGFNAGHLILAVLTGAVAGAGVAYLTAPNSGIATRDRIRTIAHDTNTAAHHVPEAVRRATVAAREAFITALELEDEAELAVAKPRKSVRQDHATA